MGLSHGKGSLKFPSHFSERILTPGLRSREQDVFWSSHAYRHWFLRQTPLPRRTASGGPPVTSKGVCKAKGSKQGGPFSFEIEDTEPRKNRNPVNPGILPPNITLNGNKPSAYESIHLR